MSIKIVDGVEYYLIEDSKGGLLLNKKTAEQIGYLDDDGTIDYVNNGKTHEKNKENL